MRFWNKKEYSNRFFYVRFEIKKLALKSLLGNGIFNRSHKFFFQKLFLFFTKRSSISFYRNRCLINDWSHCVFRKFKMSRHQSKAFSSFGFVCGMRKASF